MTTARGGALAAAIALAWLGGAAARGAPRCAHARSALARQPARTRQPARMSTAGDGPVGFVGLGIMGQGMVDNLLSSGHSLVVWSRDGSKCDRLAAEHPTSVAVAASPREVVERCALTWAMLSTPEASQAVFEGADGLLAGVGTGKAIVDCATLTPERMREMAHAVRARGGLFAEAPVSGSKAPAAQGTLIFLASGDEMAISLGQSGFDAMGKALHVYGAEAGMGTRMKLAVNMVMAAQLAAIGEGVALCEAAGLSAAQLVDVLSEGAMDSPMVRLKGKAMAERAYPPAFPLCHAQKDVRFALLLADELGVGLPVAGAANELFKRAKGEGRADDDFAAVCETSRGTPRGSG